jgi:serine/threonine protein kinase
MASVYLALDERRLGVHQLCAVKIPLPDLREKRECADMFVDEARIAAQIAHPNVCTVLDYGIDQGIPYLVMEYVCGETLGQIGHALGDPAAGRRPGAERAALVARMVADVAAGLHALHELQSLDGKPLGAIHRDVSPDNVIVSCCGQAKLLDFGLVRAAGQLHESRAGLLKGKLSYLPPEVLEGATLDRRGDVWSLGVILWELLTSRRLFRRDGDVATLGAVRKAEIQTPSEVRCDVPRPLDEVVLAALSRDPNRRFATAQELAEALLRAAARRGAWPEPLQIQRFIRARFAHDPGCSQRRLSEARDAGFAEETASSRRIAFAHSPAPSRSRRERVGPVAWAAAGTAIATLGWLAGGAQARPTSGQPTATPALSLTANRLTDGLLEAPVSSELLRIEIVDAEGRRLLSRPVSDLAGAIPHESR